MIVMPDVVRFELNRNKLGEAAGIEAIESIHEFLPVYPHGEESAGEHSDRHAPRAARAASTWPTPPRGSTAAATASPGRRRRS